MNSVAVVVVDVQKDFLDPTMPPGVGSWAKAFCVAGVERLLDCARSRGWRVIHVGTQHEDRATLPLHHQKHGIPLYCETGSLGAEFVIQPVVDDTVLYKNWYSAFDAGLADHLGPETCVVWAGVASDCCIQQSAFEADRRGIHSLVPYQAVSASSASAYVGSLVGMAKSVCDVVDLSDVAADPGTAAPALDGDAIESRAGEWYRGRADRLDSSDDLRLDAALAQLRD